MSQPHDLIDMIFIYSIPLCKLFSQAQPHRGLGGFSPHHLHCLLTSDFDKVNLIEWYEIKHAIDHIKANL